MDFNDAVLQLMIVNFCKETCSLLTALANCWQLNKEWLNSFEMNSIFLYPLDQMIFLENKLFSLLFFK